MLQINTDAHGIDTEKAASGGALHAGPRAMLRQSFRSCVVFPFVLLTLLVTAPAAVAQTPGQPPAAPTTDAKTPPWTGSIGLGFTMNRGNTDTTDFNVTFDAKSDPKKKGVWKFKGLYQRNETSGTSSADRLVFDVRYERTITDRVYGYGAIGFLRDRFKRIDYLWAPGAGIGYKLVATEQTTFNVDA